MKNFRIYTCVLTCFFLLTGCGRAAESSVSSSADVASGAGASESNSAGVAQESGTSESSFVGETSEMPRSAFEIFLTGDISLFDSADIDTWGLNTWKETILSYGGLEYVYLDLDGDGMEELLVQYTNDPCTFNSVFHYGSGGLCCWQYDCVEADCRDYPLQDGTMVRQYDYNGSRSYKVFRYQSDGEAECFLELFAREELAYPDSADPCPYYEVDGEEVDETMFEEQLKELITDRMLERSAWTEL